MAYSNRSIKVQNPILPAINLVMVQIPAAALLIVQERKLLLAFSSRKQAWYLPGGKIDAGESTEEALVWGT